MTEPTDQPPTPPPPPPSGQPGGAYYPPPPPMPYTGPGEMPPVRRNGMGTAALILAIIALVLCWSVVGGVILGLIAVVLGFVGRGRAKRGEANNGSVALAGILLGALAILAGLAFIALWVSVIRGAGFNDYYDCMTKAGQDQDAQQKCADQFTHNLETKFSVTLTDTP
jgi:hypothetical protein